MRALILATALAVATGPAFAADTQVQQGEKAFQYSCAPCHGRGKGMGQGRLLPGSDALNVKYQGTKPPFLEDRTDLPAGYVKLAVRQGIESMPSFRKTELSDANLEAIAEYLARNTK